MNKKLQKLTNRKPGLLKFALSSPPQTLHRHTWFYKWKNQNLEFFFRVPRSLCKISLGNTFFGSHFLRCTQFQILRKSLHAEEEWREWNVSREGECQSHVAHGERQPNQVENLSRRLENRVERKMRRSQVYLRDAFQGGQFARCSSRPHFLCGTAGIFSSNGEF